MAMGLSFGTNGNKPPSYTNGRNGTGIDPNIFFAVPDGHLAGDQVGNGVPVNATYEVFDKGGITIYHQKEDRPLRDKHDGAKGYIKSLELPVAVQRPDQFSGWLKEGRYQAAVLGSDAFIDGYADHLSPRYLSDNNVMLLDPEGHESLVKKLADTVGLEVVYSFGVRPSYSGVAVLREHDIYTWKDVEDQFGKLEKQHLLRKLKGLFVDNGQNGHPIFVAEYVNFAQRLLDSYGIGDKFRVVKSNGSTANRLHSDADAVLETVEGGTEMNTVGARVIRPPVARHSPFLFMRKDAPQKVRSTLYTMREALEDGTKRNRRENPSAYSDKLSYSNIGWEEVPVVSI